MSRAPVQAVLLDAGGVLLDLDYAFLARLLEARGLTVPLEGLSRAESIARTEIDRRVRAADAAGEPAAQWSAVRAAILDELARG